MKKIIIHILSFFVLFYMFTSINLFGDLSSLDSYRIIVLSIIPIIWYISIYYLFSLNYKFMAIINLLILFEYIITEKLTLGVIGFKYGIPSVLLFSISILMISLFIILIVQKYKSKSKSLYLLFTICIFIPIIYTLYIFIGYYLYYLQPLSQDILYTIYQTDHIEIYEYIIDNINISVFLAIITPAIFAIIFYINENIKKTLKVNIKFFIFTLFLFLILLNLGNIRLINFIFNGYTEYKKELKLFNEIITKRDNIKVDLKTKKANNNEVTVVVIGESLNKNHMNLYGYLRKTTPFLNKEDILIFQNVYSNSVTTMPTLSYSLTEANQLNKKVFFKSLSLVDIFKNANYETYWITNQRLMGPNDNLVGAIAKKVDHLISVRNKKLDNDISYDENIIPYFKDIITNKKINQNKIIFIHLMGSHAKYSLRYPNKYNKFIEWDNAIFGNKLDSYKTNTYDNSVLYNDYILHKIISILKNSNTISNLIYFSDHSEDVTNNKGHNPDDFTFEMTEIPMIIWFSKHYKKIYSDKYNILKNNISKLYTNDFIYDTVIGLNNIYTNHYNSEYDLSNINFKLDINNTHLLHNKIKFINKLNYKYNRKNNIKLLHLLNKNNIILPHRVDTIGKLKDIEKYNLNGYEVDLYYYENNNNPYIIVGHDDSVQTFLSLDTFLLNNKNINKIWFDFKNLNKDNIDNIIKYLNKLNKKYSFKEKVVFEAYLNDDIFFKISNDGYNTIHPIGLQDKKLIPKLLMMIKNQKLKGISFPASDYDYVKKEIEPFLEESISYHIWDTSLSYGDINLLSKIKLKRYFYDKKVKTILISFNSQYDIKYDVGLKVKIKKFIKDILGDQLVNKIKKII